MNRTTCLAALLLSLSAASLAEAQPSPDWLRNMLAEDAPEPRATKRSAVLMVEDEGRPAISERVGALLYRRFLHTGAYDRVKTILGRKDANARLAAAICQVGRDADVVDVFLSVHTTSRKADELEALIPPKVRAKLRLVYSTACYGNDHERAAWEALGAKTVVTHVGVNNPLIALPCFLSHWMDGRSVRAATTVSYRETRAVSTYLLSLPGMPTEAELGSDEPVNGSRPVVSGDRFLTIGSGMAGSVTTPDLPKALKYRRERGGPLGLVLRALIGLRIEQGDLKALLRTFDLAQAPIPVDDLEAIERISIERHSSGEGQIVITLGRELEFSLDQGAVLQLSKSIVIRPGVFDSGRRRLELHLSGVWVKKSVLRARLTRATLRPSEDDGYEVKVKVALFGMVPWSHSLSIGGSQSFDPDRTQNPIFSPGSDGAPTPASGAGIASALSSAGISD